MDMQLGKARIPGRNCVNGAERKSIDYGAGMGSMGTVQKKHKDEKEKWELAEQ